MRIRALIVSCVLAGAALGQDSTSHTPAAFDWVGTGTDCKLFAAGDLNGDGFADVVTINGNRDLCVSFSVNGWKAGPWTAVASDVNPEGVGLMVADVDAGSAGPEIVKLEKDKVLIVGEIDGGKAKIRKEIAAPSSVQFARVIPAGKGEPLFLTESDSAGFWFRDAVFSPRERPDSHRENPGAVDLGATLDPVTYFTTTENAIKGNAAAHAPIHERTASLGTWSHADFNGDGAPDVLLVYDCAKPYAHRAARVAFGANSESKDSDSDGLTNDEETSLGTDSLNRDTDADGLLDGWEVKGLPRTIELGALIKLYSPAVAAAPPNSGPSAAPGTDPASPDSPKTVTATDPAPNSAAATPPPAGSPTTAGAPIDQLSPLRQDVIVNLSYFEGVDPKQFEAEMPKVQRLYRELPNVNPDGTRGIYVHFRVLPDVVPKAEHTMPWWDIGNKYFAKRERGLMHWMQVTPWGGGQSSQTGDMGGAGNNWMVFAHEFGHQMSLGHTGDSEPAWCPLYTSLMSYAFSYGFDGSGEAIHFSDGRFRGTVLDERSLSEKLPYSYDKLKYLATWPFRFTLKDNSGPGGDGTTLIDWNHNGKFDEGTVEADVNYGGSTYCGTRHNNEKVGSGPALAYVGDVCYLVAADQTKDHLWIKSYLGDDKWSEARNITNSGTERDPVLVGGKDFGLVLHHHLYGWHVTRFDAKEVGTPAKIPDLPTHDLNACRVGERVLIVSRRDNDELEYRWLTFKDNDFTKPVVSAAAKLEARSLVTPGLGVDPADGRVLLVTSMHNSKGGIYSMRVTWMKPEGDRVWEQELKWTRGEGSGNGCCARPVVTFTNAGQLNIFHQGGPDATGQMIAYRTSRVGNASLDEGWLTCMLYDVWTRSRVPVGFANGPQGAIFAYRWDAGGDLVNMLQTAHNGFGIDTQPMRDFNDGEQMSLWGIRQSILYMQGE